MKRLLKPDRVRGSRGFSLLELLVASILISILATVLLNRLRFYQEAAEKANVEYTISALKSALRVQRATMMVEGRMRDLALIEKQNPMDWLEEKPANYVPAIDDQDSKEKCTGCWYFDQRSRAVVYRPVRGDYLQPDSSGEKRIRLRVKTLRGLAEASSLSNDEGVIIRVSLEEVEPYKWFW